MQIERRKPLTARVGIFCAGHHTYWNQYPGLQEELLGYHAIICQRLEAYGVQVTDFGMTDDAESAYRMVSEIKQGDFDLVFCNLSTYATSATWGIMVREIQAPLVMIALQPRRSFDFAAYTTHLQLANDQVVSLPEFAGVAVRMGKPVPPMVIGSLYDDPRAEGELAEWCAIARVLHSLRRARIGQMGHTLEAMLDMHSDHTMLTAAFGLHIVQTEPDEILRELRQVTADELYEKRTFIEDFFATPDPVSDPHTLRLTEDDLETAARVAAALDRFITARNLDGLAYYYEAEPGSEMRRLVTNLIVGNSILSAQGFPMCGENDLKTCIAMLILDRLEIGGSFAEFHPIVFDRNQIYVGHDGPHHLSICQGKPVLRSLLQYHGKPGSGASVEFMIKHGPITMLGIGQTYDGRLKFVIGEGESVEGPLPPTGNTNTLAFFEPDPVTYLKAWCGEGPTHHFALGIGHHAHTLKKLGDTLGIEAVIVDGASGR
ncbi:MAG: L-fucose/L-arabinose isomerase family protein [Caldilineaceae bacterium]|nr:L-fucose/L-arabinose isomerase family protein [Caldilineaceae bacterium]